MSTRADGVVETGPSPVDQPTDSRGPLLAVAISIFTAITLIVMTMRILGRALFIKRIGADDITILAATIFAIALSVVSLVSIPYGLGRHFHLVKSDEYQMIMHLGYFNHLSSLISLGFTRASILLQVLRLAPTSKLRRILQGLLILSTIFTIITLFSHILICGAQPSLYWTTVKAITGEKPCMPYFRLQQVTSAWTITLDFLVWLSPLRLVWMVKLRLWEKSVLLGAFAVGAIVWISGIIRICLIANDFSKTTDANVAPDPTYGMAVIALWFTLEAHAAIICTSLPALRPVVGWCFPKLQVAGSRSGRTAGSSTGNMREDFQASKKSVKRLHSHQDCSTEDIMMSVQSDDWK
ncbi:hypothetical protein EX30DRAFT_345075 [Ascodesmis nigricans]|uniref:Rhodopsin domain-containing protein n=1 Tax=Ascodesmis nigricans TaxID=341454 RepID=A0A4S2MH75_9PEZI|nr:hypothetical protein EX30DRAFT_345075 [Ascodesmis nigricans]